MVGSSQRRLRDKGRKVEEYLADVVATLRGNVKEGLRSAIKGDRRRLGRPPTGRPPTGRPPTGRPPSSRPPFGQSSRASQWR